MPQPSKTDGVNVLPTLLGKDQDLSDRFLYWEQASGRFDQGVRWKNWKAVRLGAKSPLQLFNLANDPSETTDIASAHADVIGKFEEYLKTTRTESEEWPVAGK